MVAVTHTAAPAAPAAPIRVPLIAWVAVMAAVAVVYLVLHENGALLAAGAETLHELFHDGRHALGVPCH